MDPPGSSAIIAAARLANGFVLDLVKLGSHGRAVLDPLLRTAVLHANQAWLLRDPDLRLRYATLEDDVPDDLRRPVTTSAIAQSLGVPFETARRRIHAVAAAGGLQLSDQGLIVPHSVTNSAAFRTGCQLQFEMVRELYGKLRSLGLLRDSRGRFIAPPGDPPVRLVGRLVVEFVLRFQEPLAQNIGHAVTSLVLMQMWQCNTEPLPFDEDLPRPGAAGGGKPESRGKPVSVAKLSAGLGIPHETVRRHVAWLAEKGLSQRVPRGYALPPDALGRSPFAELIAGNLIHLSRMFAAFAELGILQAWEEGEAGGATAA